MGVSDSLFSCKAEMIENESENESENERKKRIGRRWR